MGFGSGFGGGLADGFVSGAGVRQRQEALKMEQQRVNMAQAEADRRAQSAAADRADGETLASIAARYAGIPAQDPNQPDPSQRPPQPQMGVQVPQPPADGVGPPADVQGPPMGVQPPQAVPPPPGSNPGAPLTYDDAKKKSDSMLREIAPVMIRMVARHDPAKAAEFASDIAKKPIQDYIAHQAATATLLLSNPNSSEARDAAADMFRKMPGHEGMSMDPSRYQVLDNGAIKFGVLDKDGKDAGVQVITPGQIQGLVMRGLTPVQIMAEINKAKELGIDKQKADATEAHYKAIEGIERATLGVRQSEAAANREFRASEGEANREVRREAIESRKDASERNKRDDLLRGIDSVTIGDSKSFSDRDPADQAERLSQRADALSASELNGAKNSSESARYASLTRLFASGQGQVLQSKSDPSIVYVNLGGVTFKLPRDASAVGSYFKNRAQTK